MDNSMGQLIRYVLSFVLVVQWGLLPVANAKASKEQQMCQQMMQMMMMMQQMKAQAADQAKQEKMAYYQGQFNADIKALFSRGVSRADKKIIQERIVANTPLTEQQLGELRKLSPGQQQRKLAEITSQLQNEMKDGGIQSSANNAMMMMIVGMLLCSMMGQMK